MSDEMEKRRVYYIPENFADGSGVFGGMFPLRNFVEGCIMALPGTLMALKLPVGIQGKIVALFCLAAAPLVLGCKGINGDCVSNFLVYFFKFRKARRLVRYNPRVKLEYTGELQLSRSELPREKIRKMLANLGQHDRQDNTESDRYYAIDSNIAFEDDIKLEKQLLAKTAAKKGGNQ